jgi:hypothetical protein
MSKQKQKKKPSDGSLELSSPADVLFRLEHRLEEMRAAYVAGNPIGLLDALMLILQSGTYAPDWIIEAAVDQLSPLIAKGVAAGQGRTGNTLAKYRSDMVHYRRWSAVVEFHASGKSLDECYEAAQITLKGGFAQGEHESIRKSYNRVRKHLADPKERLRYYRGLPLGRHLTGTQSAGRRLKLGVLGPPKGKK